MQAHLGAPAIIWAGIADCVRRSVAIGELHADTGKEPLATVFDSFLTGHSTVARDGTSESRLDAAFTLVMLVWDAAKLVKR